MDKDIYERDYEFIPFDNYLKPEQDEERPGDLEEKVSGIREEKDKPEDEGFLKDILTDKISFLREILTEIDTQIKERESLKDTIMDKIDKGLCYLQTKIYEIDSWGIGRNRNIDLRRSKIEKEIEALKQQKRDEARESWRDIALLKKEHREFFHEYRNALRRVKVIFPEKASRE